MSEDMETGQHLSERRRRLSALMPALLQTSIDTMVQGQKENPVEIRPDYIKVLQLAQAAPLAGLDEITVARLAKRVWHDTCEIIKAMDARSYPERVLGICFFCQYVLDRGESFDATNQGILVSLDLVREAKEDEGGPPWFFDERRAQELGWQAFRKARELGVFGR